ncbi:MAG TPA: 16S rRNA (adenine(1518)-N(6)/adenine(1519)-N(6))-dimethyltransferase RsmA [Dehalococcoidia bacterium]|nr:16S rRNA (adenine(1518)-N(6)/adenine(1519)-N(6))-dimethyltransferase RsmA [Dehalococcoidia bacterium]
MVSLPTGIRAGWTFTSSLPDRTRSRSRSPRPYRPRVLRDAGVSPVKALGQHFLTDQRVLSRIVAAAGLTAEDTVIEVGPGLGALTERLVLVAGRVVAVELDAKLAARLNETVVAEHPNLTVVQRDILTVSPEELLGTTSAAPMPPYAVVGNLPYNIGAAVLRHFLEAQWQPRWLIAMLQREVAESVCAEPGDMGLLGVSVQVYAEARRLFTVPPRAFYPPPKVTSSVIRLAVRPEPLVPAKERQRFFAVVRAGFSAPRKQLANSLANGLKRPVSEVRALIEQAELDVTLRPQMLSIEEWRKLAQTI